MDGIAAAIVRAQELAGDRIVEVAADDVGGQVFAAGLVDEVRIKLPSRTNGAPSMTCLIGQERCRISEGTTAISVAVLRLLSGFLQNTQPHGHQVLDQCLPERIRIPGDRHGNRQRRMLTIDTPYGHRERRDPRLAFLEISGVSPLFGLFQLVVEVGQIDPGTNASISLSSNVIPSLHLIPWQLSQHRFAGRSRMCRDTRANAQSKPERVGRLNSVRVVDLRANQGSHMDGFLCAVKKLLQGGAKAVTKGNDLA